MKVWVYRSRNGNHGVYKGDIDGFLQARQIQDDDNRMSLDEFIEEFGIVGVSGSFDDGYFSLDDGGDIELFEVQE